MPSFFFLDSCTLVQNSSDNPFSLRSLFWLLYFEVEDKNIKIWFLIILDELSYIPSQSVTCMASGWWTPRRWWRRRSGGSKSQLSTCAWRAQTDKSGKGAQPCNQKSISTALCMWNSRNHTTVCSYSTSNFKTVNMNTLVYVLLLRAGLSFWNVSQKKIEVSLD